MSSEDADLVSRCLDRQPGADRLLIERFQSEVYAFCYRVLNHRQDAEDVVQETFVRVFRSLRRWDATRPLKPWIYSIAFNRCRTWISQRVRRPEPVDYLQDTPARNIEDDSAELQREIDQALTEIRPDYRHAFILFHEQGLSYDEIAEILGCPVGTVKTWLFRTRAHLLQALRERGVVPQDM